MNRRVVTINVKEFYSDETLFVKERLLATFEVPHTRGFETFIVPCIKPAYHTRISLEMETDVLVYVSSFGFSGYSPFGATRKANMYYDIADTVLTDSKGRRVFDEEVVLESSAEWISYDMQLKEGLFYVYANSSIEENLEIEMIL